MWSNLKELGYGPDLNRLDMQKPIITASTTAANKLPRYILSNNPIYFEFLFQLLSKLLLIIKLLDLGEDVSGIVWRLLFQLAPCEADIQKVLNISSANFDWETLFPPLKPNESFYNLFIVQSMLMDFLDPDVAQVQKENQSEERKAWKKNFIVQGGLNWAVTVFLT